MRPKGWHSHSLGHWRHGPASYRPHGSTLVGVVTTSRHLPVLGGTETKHLVLAQDLGEEHLFAKPNIFCHFTQGIGDPKYCPVTDVAHLNKLLTDVLDSYNEVNAVMNLVRTTGARGPDTWPGHRSPSTSLSHSVPYIHRHLPRPPPRCFLHVDLS